MHWIKIEEATRFPGFRRRAMVCSDMDARIEWRPIAWYDSSRHMLMRNGKPWIMVGKHLRWFRFSRDVWIDDVNIGHWQPGWFWQDFKAKLFTREDVYQSVVEEVDVATHQDCYGISISKPNGVRVGSVDAVVRVGGNDEVLATYEEISESAIMGFFASVLFVNATLIRHGSVA